MSKKTIAKKALSGEQREELLLALEVRFEKNMKRHKGLEWAKVHAKLTANPIGRKNFGHSMKWKIAAVSQTSSAMIKRRANIFFMIVPRKVPKDEEVFVTIVKHWIPGKKINLKIVRWIWQRPWALSF